jgi:hypothetical protein
MSMIDHATKEGVIAGQIETLLRVRYYLPPIEVRAEYEIAFKNFAQWADAQGLQALPASGHVAAAYLLDLVFAGKAFDEVKIVAEALFFAHELAQQYIDIAPMRAALIFAMRGEQPAAA